MKYLALLVVLTASATFAAEVSWNITGFTAQSAGHVWSADINFTLTPGPNTAPINCLNQTAASPGVFVNVTATPCDEKNFRFDFIQYGSPPVAGGVAMAAYLEVYNSAASPRISGVYQFDDLDFVKCQTGTLGFNPQGNSIRYEGVADFAIVAKDG